jgi:hypothetical protein
MDYSQSHVVTFVKYLNILKKTIAKEINEGRQKERKGKTSD